MATSAPSFHTTNRANADEWPSLRLYQRECGQQSFSVANLVYLQSETNYTWLIWKEGKRMLMPRTLKYYEPQLPDQYFFRLHRNCLVNARYIVGVERSQSGPYVQLTTGDRLPISRRRWTSIKKMVDTYAQMN